MITLPLPILTCILATVMCFLVWRSELGHKLAKILFIALFLIIALGAFLVALRFGYGVVGLQPLQRALPLFVGPIIFLGFAVQAREEQTASRLVAIHLALATLAVVLPYIVPPLQVGFDALISLSGFVYSVALLLLWRKGADHLSFARIELLGKLHRLNLIAALTLMMMVCIDVAIAYSFATQRSDSALAFISIGSIISIAILIAVIFFVSSKSGSRVMAEKSSEQQSADKELIRKTDELMLASKLYLDTGLTIERLAKRMHVPARSLSEAINRVEGVNVSQFVNGYRLRHAIELLKETDLSVTKIVEQSGFIARSNFYREFERVHKQSPASYRAKL